MSQTTKVKICGNQDMESALAAADAGADFLGFVFVPGVRRQLPEEHAQELIAQLRERYQGSRLPTLVGLFADQPVDDVNRIAQKVNVDMVQLCGHEEMHYCAQMVKPIIKVIHVRSDCLPGAALPQVVVLMDRHSRAGHLCTLEGHVEGQPGGTGQPFDWSIARGLPGSYRFMLAGGLTPENVAQAVLEVGPWGVDVSSGVETEGEKDPQKIVAFIEAVRRADAQRKRSRGLMARARALLRSGPREETPS